jgi:hypothetical protein
MLGWGVTRPAIMWRYVMRGTLLPFVLGSILGAAAGAQVFVGTATVWLQAILRSSSCW